MLSPPKLVEILRHSLRVYGAMLAFVPSTFFLFPDLGRWHPYNVAYEHMFAAIFFAWGLCLYLAASNPAASVGLINFTALQGLLHGGVMFADALLGTHHSYWHFVGDVPFHCSMFFVLGYLRKYAPLAAVEQVSRSLQVRTVMIFAIIGGIVLYTVFIRL
jgi:hypothetical protein